PPTPPPHHNPPANTHARAPKPGPQAATTPRTSRGAKGRRRAPARYNVGYSAGSGARGREALCNDLPWFGKRTSHTTASREACKHAPFGPALAFGVHPLALRRRCAIVAGI